MAAQVVSGQHPDRTLAQLGAASASTGKIYTHTTGADGTDCTVGGGSTRVVCFSDGSTWLALTATSGAPTGSAGGDLSGTYPNPSVTDDSHAHTTTTVSGLVEADISDLSHFSPTAGISTDHGAGAVSALTDIGDLCAGDQLLERNAGDTAWACIDTSSVGGVGTASDTELLYSNAGSVDGSTLKFDGTDHNFSSGKVGIGGSPNVDLYVVSSDNTAARVRSTGAGSRSSFQLQNDASTWHLMLEGAHGDAFEITHATGSASPFVLEFGVQPDTLRLDSTGKVGINDTTPDAQLNIVTNATGTVGLLVEGSVGHTADLLQIDADGDGTLTDGGLKVDSSGDLTQYGSLTVTPDGTNAVLTVVDDGTVTIGESALLALNPQASAPATCSIGEIYSDDSGAMCACTAADTWSNMTGTGACT